jgi:hypothetical protein
MTPESLIQTLTQCVKHCRICTQHCLEVEDINNHRSTLRLSIECADFCDSVMKLLIMNSPYAARATALCAEMCNEFSTACLTFPEAHYQECATVCQETAEQCEAFVRG